MEPIARAQLAALTSEDVCGRFVEGMPNGVAVLIAGGNIQQTWSLERIFAEADQAMGVDVLATLYAQMGLRHLPIDLNQLWLDQGVQWSEGRLVLDDSAPKAAIRQEHLIDIHLIYEPLSMDGFKVGSGPTP